MGRPRTSVPHVGQDLRLRYLGARGPTGLLEADEVDVVLVLRHPRVQRGRRWCQAYSDKSRMRKTITTRVSRAREWCSLSERVVVGCVQAVRTHVPGSDEDGHLLVVQCLLLALHVAESQHGNTRSVCMQLARGVRTPSVISSGGTERLPRLNMACKVAS